MKERDEVKYSTQFKITKNSFPMLSHSLKYINVIEMQHIAKEDLLLFTNLVQVSCSEYQFSEKELKNLRYLRKVYFYLKEEVFLKRTPRTKV